MTPEKCRRIKWVKLSIQRALLGEVNPSLRGMAFRFGKDDNTDYVETFFYHDGPICEELENHYSCIDFESSAYFTQNRDQIEHDAKLERIDFPAPLPDQEFWVYKRREPFEDPQELRKNTIKSKKFPICDSKPQQIHFHRTPETMTDEQFNRFRQVKLSIQQALLGEVNPSLRAVTFRFGEQRSTDYVEIFFYHDGPLSDEIKNHYSCIDCEASNYYTENRDQIEHDTKIEQLDFPTPLPSQDYWVYRRREPFEDPTEF